jgi:DNA-binding MarR family transcriptional regulator
MKPGTVTTPQSEIRRLTKEDRELGYRLGAVMLRCFSADGGAAIRVIDESGLTFSQMKVLMTLAGANEEPLTVKALAERIGISLPSASRAVDGLVKHGLAVRTEDPDDRRQRRLTLSAGGQRLADGIVAARLEGLGQFAASLDDRERELLGEALELLLERDDVADVYGQFRRQARL